MTSSKTKYNAILDHPAVSNAIFHPRPEWGRQETPDRDHMISVAPGVHVGARFHMAHPTDANILFFHGNGEIVADYDELAPLFNRIGVNFLVVDYRGYGRSGGTPTVSTMLADSHLILSYVLKWLASRQCSGPMVVMGRSLGSAPALELAATHGEVVNGLIIESGFAMAAPLLRLLGVDVTRMGFEESKGFRNTDKIQSFKGPTLIIHAEYDHIIPFADGQALYDASGSARKRLLCIQGANHNDILYVGMDQYMQSVADFARGLGHPADA